VTDLGDLGQEAVRLISDATGRGIELRALGSVGVRMHCDSAAIEMERRGREPKDIDLVTRKRNRRQIRSFFEHEGYEADRNMLVAMEGTRYLFRNPATGLDVDLWVDVLDFCHRLDVTDRMGSGPSLPIEDLLLSKLQIVELTENDRHDLAAILGTHDIGIAPDDPEVIDSSYVAGVLSRDWGFWRTATGNLESIIRDQSSDVVHRIERLLEQIEIAPKSLKWRARAKVGERSQWWQEVDIPRDTY
jgi:hypothetical protein